MTLRSERQWPSISLSTTEAISSPSDDNLKERLVELHKILLFKASQQGKEILDISRTITALPLHLPEAWRNPSVEGFMQGSLPRQSLPRPPSGPAASERSDPGRSKGGP